MCIRDRPYDAAAADDNLVDPPLLDTALITTRTYLKLRFVADNPGMWPFHCHLLVHLAEGLQVVFNVAQAEQLEPPASWWRAQTYELVDAPPETTGAAASSGV